MDVVLLINHNMKADHINMVRGDKRFVQKILEQVFCFSKPEITMLFTDGQCEKNTKRFVVHENFNHLHHDIESLRAIQVLLRDIEQFQTGEHVQILRDAVIRIEKTIQGICQNFSE